MYFTAIPELVSIELDSHIKKIKGFHLCNDLNFFARTKTKLPFHYKITLDNEIPYPSRYSLRSEQFFKFHSSWYFYKILPYYKLIMSYDPAAKSFRVNKNFLRLPQRVGGIFTFGEMLSDIIGLELFKEDFYIFRGIAVLDGDNAKCLVTPGYNGKTTFLAQLLKNGNKYISEDILLFSSITQKVYPTCPFLKLDTFHKRQTRNPLNGLLKKDSIIKNPVPITNFQLIHNVTDKEIPKATPTAFDHLLLNSFYFLNNLNTRAMAFDAGLGEKILNANFGKVLNRVKPHIEVAYNFNFRKGFDYGTSK